MCWCLLASCVVDARAGHIDNQPTIEEVKAACMLPPFCVSDSCAALARTGGTRVSHTCMICFSNTVLGTLCSLVLLRPASAASSMQLCIVEQRQQQHGRVSALWSLGVLGLLTSVLLLLLCQACSFCNLLHSQRLQDQPLGTGGARA